MMGCKGAGHAGLKFTDLKLDPIYLLGEEGQGMEVAIHSLSVSRVHIACSNLGMAQRMLEISLKRAADRVTFGKPIIKRQAIKMKIANMQMMIHALRTLVYDFARDFDIDQNRFHRRRLQSTLFSIDTVRLPMRCSKIRWRRLFEDLLPMVLVSDAVLCGSRKVLLPFSASPSLASARSMAVAIAKGAFFNKPGHLKASVL